MLFSQRLIGELSNAYRDTVNDPNWPRAERWHEVVLGAWEQQLEAIDLSGNDRKRESTRQGGWRMSKWSLESTGYSIDIRSRGGADALPKGPSICSWEFPQQWTIWLEESIRRSNWEKVKSFVVCVVWAFLVLTVKMLQRCRNTECRVALFNYFPFCDTCWIRFQ